MSSALFDALVEYIEAKQALNAKKATVDLDEDGYYLFDEVVDVEKLRAVAESELGKYIDDRIKRVFALGMKIR